MLEKTRKGLYHLSTFQLCNLSIFQSSKNQETRTKNQEARTKKGPFNLATFQLCNLSVFQSNESNSINLNLPILKSNQDAEKLL
jgi:hypothetical protein